MRLKSHFCLFCVPPVVICLYSWNKSKKVCRYGRFSDTQQWNNLYIFTTHYYFGYNDWKTYYIVKKYLFYPLILMYTKHVIFISCYCCCSLRFIFYFGYFNWITLKFKYFNWVCCFNIYTTCVYCTSFLQCIYHRGQRSDVHYSIIISHPSYCSFSTLFCD